MTRDEAVGLLRHWRLRDGEGRETDAARLEERIIAAMMFAPADPAAGYCPPPVLMAPPGLTDEYWAKIKDMLRKPVGRGGGRAAEPAAVHDLRPTDVPNGRYGRWDARRRADAPAVVEGSP